MKTFPLSMNHPSRIRAHFPFFQHHPELCYLDNAATTQKPRQVIEAMMEFYEKGNVNVHRGLYPLASRVSQQYEEVREKVARFLGAGKKEEILFTSGTTAGINQVAFGFLAPRLQAGDEVLVSAMEHHANLLPWQQVCQERGARLRMIPLSPAGEIDLVAFREMLSPRCRMLAIVHVSNSLGTINPIAEMIHLAHQQQVPVLVDGAQSAAHQPIRLEAWQADFFACSAHKMYGPTGVGVLYAREKWQAEMKPYQFGGGMVRRVEDEQASFAAGTRRFEGGTRHVAGVMGLGAAIDFLEGLDKKGVTEHVADLREYATEKLLALPGLRLFGEASEKVPILSFSLGDIHPHDVATFLGEANIAVRAGHHCTQPLMRRLGVAATCRASFSLYNRREEADRLQARLKDIQRFFQ